MENGGSGDAAASQAPASATRGTATTRKTRRIRPSGEKTGAAEWPPPRVTSQQPAGGAAMKPRSVVGKLSLSGKTDPMSRSATPNHLQSVAPYWSDAVVGIHRPRPFEPLFVVSSGPPVTSEGKI